MDRCAIIISHLIMRGFVEDYTVWIHHGETVIVNNENYAMHV